MNAEISVARRDVYSPAGLLDTTLYEVQAAIGGELIQDIQFEHPEDLIALRDILTEYIERNNLSPQGPITEQP